jgi:hypothetical protein
LNQNRSSSFFVSTWFLPANRHLLFARNTLTAPDGPAKDRWRIQRIFLPANRSRPHGAR